MLDLSSTGGVREDTAARVGTVEAVIPSFHLNSTGGVQEDTAARVGKVAEVIPSLPGVAGFDLQTLAKCPFLEHRLHTASLSRHLCRACLPFPQKKHLDLATTTAAAWLVPSSGVFSVSLADGRAIDGV